VAAEADWRNSRRVKFDMAEAIVADGTYGALQKGGLRGAISFRPGVRRTESSLQEWAPEKPLAIVTAPQT